ncbi:FAD dependent oxidoreductase [Drepanopeziza brunnea f. sp. 'multigermtubi' MB_m1]|uniref:FAD dependent oxidoreductase n=2 Tax=Drepanopeziza brunnea f. sp. 'multigermtubi' TaxID=698441 RepID=K1WUC8_MARBU|nr:FAD dependent oxidoreductase [Drepanopeziza brunnea f. sp. 'multigermtubi' MB_m1]EKD12188.1 FAD dependent oxidoreductase [Drepanopeziza brunnea f. sp. 'multigermtubi' MB_m1]
MAQSIGVIGGGITGLACAFVLSSKFNVTIVARDLPGDLGQGWASPWAGATFHPQRDATKSEQQMQRTSFRFYWELAQRNPSSGVKALPMTEYFDSETREADLWYRDLMPDWRVLPASEIPSGLKTGVAYTAVAMNPQLLLPWLQETLVSRGVIFIRAEVTSFDEARSITKSEIIVNASGLGAGILARDNAVRPIRGQTMFVKTDFGRLVMMEGSEYTYIIPRPGSGGAIIGGVKSPRLDSEVDVSLKSDILRRVNRVSDGAFEDIDLDTVTDVVGFRPGRDGGLRIEREGDVIHAYGAAGAGKSNISGLFICALGKER